MQPQLALTARSTAYVLSCFPPGLAALVVIPTGLALGLGLSFVFWLGLPIVAATISAGAVEKHISNVFSKLDLPRSEHQHRRVLAVLTYLGV